MNKLQVSDLMSLEDYHGARQEFRSRVIAHKRNRQLDIGPNARLAFEDRLTMQYQVQEMLRIERIFESEAIQEELDAYNPLIPDGTNLKGTFLVEFPDPEERREALKQLTHIEDRLWIQVEGGDRIFAIADEDMDREAGDKTSAVHFVRFQLSDGDRANLQRGAGLGVGIDHPNYQHAVNEVPEEIRRSLVNDFV